MRAWVGTSGWVYADWRDRVYPAGVPQREWLGWYAEHFPTVEVNASFYRLPTSDTFERWRTETPAGFTFAVKMSRYVTHIRRLREAGEGIDRLWRLERTLGDKLGPILVQLPPDLRADETLLAAFLEECPRAMRTAFEFRHASWDTDAIRERLDAAGAAWVLADRPWARVPLHVTGGWSYVRFHQGARGSPGYSRAKLRSWATRLADLPVDELFVYFNNDTGGAAVRDAQALASMLERHRVDVCTPDQVSSSP